MVEMPACIGSNAGDLCRQQERGHKSVYQHCHSRRRGTELIEFGSAEETKAVGGEQSEAPASQRTSDVNCLAARARKNMET